MSSVKRTGPETKHDRFIRLAERRTTRALEELRLVGQLSSPNYENSDAESEAIITALCGGIHQIADVFQVPFTSAVGDAAGEKSEGSVFTPTQGVRTGTPVNELDVIKALELLKKGDHHEAYKTLQAALRQQKR